jgi:hypothetical protein
MNPRLPAVRHSAAHSISEDVDAEGSSDSDFGSLSLEAGHNKGGSHTLAFSLPSSYFLLTSM